MVDIHLAASPLGKYPPIATVTEINSCFSADLNRVILQHGKMI